jgi:hypothetical protein
MAAVLSSRAASNELELTAYFIPLSTIAKWPPNVPGERRDWFITYAIALQVIASVAIASRLYASFAGHIRKPGIDDLFVVLGWVRIVLNGEDVVTDVWQVFAVCFTASTIFGMFDIETEYYLATNGD